VTRLCAVYGVTRGGYYAWRRRPVSRHAAQDRQLERRIQRLFQQHRGAYGSPRIQRALHAEGCAVSGRRVARLMRRAGLRARVVQIYRANPRLHRFYGQHPNRLWARGATRPDQIWVGDITYLPVGGRWWFLAVVLDQCSRRVLAWRLGHTRDARLTRGVLDAAVRRRRPRAGLIFHSDRGSEYAGHAFRDRLRALGIRQSTTRGGTPGDNAHMESFFHSLKAELIHGVRFATARVLRLALGGYFRYYNYRRLHSALRYRAPADYEARVA
jgi:putative transposase